MFEGWKSPFAEANQQAQDRNTAWDSIKGNLPMLGLVSGLSMLANNNGNRSFGQLLGRAGVDGLTAVGSMEAQRREAERQQAQDEERARFNTLRMQGMQGELDEQKHRRDLAERFAGGDEDALKELDPVAWWKNQQAQKQAEQALRNSMALAKYKADLEGGSLGTYASKLGGFVNPRTGVFTPVRGADGSPVVPAGAEDNSPFAKEAGKKFAQDYLDMQGKARSASETLATLDDAERVINSGIYTGFGGEAAQAFRRAANAVGLGNPDDTAAGETLKKIQNEMSLIVRNPDSGMGLPGAASDKDIEFLKSTQIGLDRSPQANRLFINAARRVKNRQLEVARMANDYVNKYGRLDSRFYTNLRDWSARNSMFDGLRQERQEDRFPLPDGFVPIN